MLFRTSWLVFKYAVFAVVAIVVNIVAQDLTTRCYAGPFHVAASMIVGTGAGLVIKYILDKRYIFRFVARDAAHDGRTFILYTAMGLATTAIFWAFELGFHHAFATKEMRYVGGIIGLMLGYLIKFYLDKQFVFHVARP
jgi:hypothetical protein